MPKLKEERAGQVKEKKKKPKQITKAKKKENYKQCVKAGEGNNHSFDHLL